MPVVLGTGFVLSEADEVPGTPWIGWHNVLFAGNVATTTNQADANNLANPSTNLKWVGTTATEQYITVSTFTYAGDVDYMGVAKHNFGSAGIAVSVEGVTTNPSIDTQTKLLLHFDGADGSTTFTDSSAGAHTFTAAGNAQIDTAQSVFGGASGLFDGTGDWITTPDHADYVLGSGDWTLECRFNRNGGDGTFRTLGGQGDLVTTTNRSITLFLTTGNVLSGQAFVGGSTFTVTGTTTFTSTGWHHVAFVRTGNTLKLFVDGTQEGGDIAIAGSINNSTEPFGIGVEGSGASIPWFGWIDEFRLSGVARYTAAFTPSTIAFPWVQLTSPAVPADDSPLMFRWDPATYYQVRLRMQAGSAAPQAAVVYIGDLLVCERSIDINVEHVPVTYGRRTHAVNGMSQSGEFLGRIVIGEHRETKAEFKWFQDTWWRTNFDPFLEAAQEIPFFWAWSPEEYPAECGYVWLTNDAEASVDPVTRRVHTELVMEGVA